MYRLLIPLVLALAAPAPAWNLDDWYLWAEPCATVEGDTLVMRCQSTGLVSNQEYSGRTSVSVRVRVTPAEDGRFWAGLALNSDVPADNWYTQAAMTHGIAPFWDSPGPYAVTLSDGGGKDHCCDWMGAVDIAEWHTLTVDYDGKGKAVLRVDGYEATTRIDLGSAFRVELLCVAVDPGESRLGAYATCEWRDLTYHNGHQPSHAPKQIATANVRQASPA